MGIVNLAILNYPGAYQSAVYGMKDILEYGDVNMEQAFNVSIISVKEFVEGKFTYDYFALPPCKGAQLERNLSNAKLIQAISRQAKRGSIPLSVCAGAFPLCAAGIANGKRATTHWDLAARLQASFPKVKVSADAMLIDEGAYVCAGGMTGYQDLSLYLIKKLISPEAAMRVAAVFLINSGERSQLQYAMQNLGLSDSPPLATAQRYIRRNFMKAITIEDVAQKLGISQRTLLRRFREAGGFSPSGYLQSTRLAHARKLLETSALGIKSVAESCGYQDLASFTRTFRKSVGLTPGQYRKINGIQ